MNRIVVCRTCRSSEAEDAGPEDVGNVPAPLAAALREAGLDGELDIATVDCMGACEEPVSIAFQGDGRATFLFSGVSFPGDIEDIVATSRVYLDAKDGWIEDARPCGRLRFCLRARVPALKP
jgi:predicted metal-binding protein